MKKLFSPDHLFDGIFTVTPDSLLSEGITVLVLDIDNTLVTYDDPRPTPEVVSWVENIKSSGINVAIASNNHGARVDLFNETLGVFTVSKSRKPSRKAIRAVCERFSVQPSAVAVIGDQIFTDVLCANRAGAKALLVTPLPYDENLFFRFKRMLERPIIAAFRRKHPEKCHEKGDAGK